MMAQTCPDIPDMSSLEVVCDYEDPFNLDQMVDGMSGEWSVSPVDGNVFVYLGWLYYQSASPGDYLLRYDVTDPGPSCPSYYEFDLQLITTALVWPIPQPVCPGEAFYVGETPLVEEGFHEVYLPAEICDSLVQVILFHDENVCEDDNEDDTEEEQINAQDTNPNSGSGEQISSNQVDFADVPDENGVGPKPEYPTNEEEPAVNNEPIVNPNPVAGSNFDSNELIFPTAFSPDNNGINDTFGLVNADLELTYYTIRIYDRWGGEVFFNDQPNARWDGVCRGKVLPNGVYTLSAQATTSNGERLWHSGTVTLLR